MASSDSERRRELVSLERQDLAVYQLDRLNCFFAEILPRNDFYQRKLGGQTSLDSIEQLADLPLTDKSELIAAGDAWAANHTFPRERYVHCHQTSGTQGRPLLVLDTSEDWQWWNEGWQYVLDAAELTSRDVCMLAFSFGPFIGFWTAFDAALHRGCLTVPGGGLSTIARLEQMRLLNATCLFCTPSYALHMAEVAADQNMDLRALSVRCLILAGEPGASVPSIRARLEQLWAAKILDHSGATEVGPWGFGNLNEPGLHINEAEFIAEFRSVATGQPAEDGELADLILTSLGRSGAPVIRYRTGDRVRPVNNHDRKVRFVWLEGGVLGRADDMMIIRGVNIFPSSVECIVREFPEIVEYRMTAAKVGEMDQLLLEIEDQHQQPGRLAAALHARLGLRIEVRQVPAGTLPRFEAKGKRFIDQR